MKASRSFWKSNLKRNKDCGKRDVGRNREHAFGHG